MVSLRSTHPTRCERALDRGERVRISLALCARKFHCDGAELFVNRRDAGIPRAERFELMRDDSVVAARNRSGQRLDRTEPEHVIEGLAHQRLIMRNAVPRSNPDFS